MNVEAVDVEAVGCKLTDLFDAVGVGRDIAVDVGIVGVFDYTAAGFDDLVLV